MSRNHLNRGAVTARRLAVLGCQLLRAGCPDGRQFLLGFLRKVPWVIILQSSSRGGASCRMIADRAAPHWRIRSSLWSSTSHPSAGYTALFALRIARSTQNHLVHRFLETDHIRGIHFCRHGFYAFWFDLISG